MVKVNNKISSILSRVKKEINQLPIEAYKEFLANTPINKGFARKNTKLKNNSIVANYPYAKRLDEGLSKQSPKGMVAPTKEFLKKRLAAIAAKK